MQNTASGKRYYIEGAKEIPLTRGDDAFRLTRALLEYPDYDPTVVVTVPLLQRVLSVNHAANVTHLSNGFVPNPSFVTVLGLLCDVM